MLAKVWSAVMAVLVLWLVLTVMVTAIQPYLWIIGVGTAIMILVLVGKVLFFRKSPWH